VRPADVEANLVVLGIFDDWNSAQTSRGQHLLTRGLDGRWSVGSRMVR